METRSTLFSSTARDWEDGDVLIAIEGSHFVEEVRRIVGVLVESEARTRARRPEFMNGGSTTRARTVPPSVSLDASSTRARSKAAHPSRDHQDRHTRLNVSSGVSGTNPGETRTSTS